MEVPDHEHEEFCESEDVAFVSLKGGGGGKTPRFQLARRGNFFGESPAIVSTDHGVLHHNPAECYICVGSARLCCSMDENRRREELALLPQVARCCRSFSHFFSSSVYAWQIDFCKGLLCQMLTVTF